MVTPEQDYTIAEDYELPSGAKIYGDSKCFDPHVTLKSMTLRDDMKRQGQKTMPHRMLCEIIDNCLLTKIPLSAYDLAIGDYEYLLHKLRVVTYGPDYKMLVGCPHCDAVREVSISLDDLKVKDFNVKDFEESLHITLPKSGKVIDLHFETPRILDSIDTKVKEFKKKNTTAEYDPTPLITLQELIDKVDGQKLSYIELETFITNLSARDANFILNKINKANSMIGLDTSVDVTCTACGGDIATFFRFGPEFFRPTNDQ